MKRQALSLIAALLLFTPLSHAADPQPTPPDEKAFQAYMSKMQAHMKTMQEQMQKMQQATAPQERQRLMQEHWASMQEGMKMMHGSDNMSGCMMMSGGPMMGGNMKGDSCCGGGNMMNGHMKGGHMMDGHMKDGHMMGSWWDAKDLPKEDMNQRMQMMGACMGMQQQMMDQMMMHQNPNAASDSKKP
jgi:hypothetical protein